MTKTKKLASVLFGMAFALLLGGGISLATILPEQNTEVATVTEAAVTGLSTKSLTDQDGGTATFYQISTADDLAKIATGGTAGTDYTWLSANYILMADIDLSGKLWTPIGTSAHPFTGKFNGNGHKITGNVDAAASQADGYGGIFGYVNGGAQIYDLLIGEFSYSTLSSSGYTAGRLAGKVDNATLFDIYDLSLINGSSSRDLKTIGTVTSSTKIYCGDVYIEGSTYRTCTANKWELDIGSGTPTNAGRSVLVNIIGQTVHKKGETAKFSGDYYRVLSTFASDLKVYSDNRYFREFAGQDYDGTVGTKQPVIVKDVGNKLTGWSSNSGTNKYYKVADWISWANSNTSQVGLVTSYWKTLTYTLSFVEGTSSTVVATAKDVKYGELWSTIYSYNPTSKVVTTKIPRAGYDLKKVYQSSKTYINNVVAYDASFNNNFTVTYPSGQRIIDWDNGGATQTVTLNSDWQAKSVQVKVKFTKTTDSGVQFDRVKGLTAAYVGNTTAINTGSATTTTTEKTYTFNVNALSNFTLTIDLDSGYEVKGVTETTTGTTSWSSSSPLKVNVSGISTAEGAIEISIARKSMTFTVTLNTMGTGAKVDSSSNDATVAAQSGSATAFTVTTKTDATFNLIVTPGTGYGYQNYSVNNVTATNLGVSADAAGTGATISFNRIDYSTGGTITINGKALHFSLKVNYIDGGNTEYNAKVAENLRPSVQIKGTNVSLSALKTTEFTSVTAPSDGTITFTLPTNNAYYSLVSGQEFKVVKGATLSTSSTGSYKVTGIVGGSAVEVTVTYAPREYTLTFNATSLAEADGKKTFPAIKNINGGNATVSDVITLTTLTPSGTSKIKFGDKLKLSYSIIKDYYEFQGWYYDDGTAVVTGKSSSIDVEVTAPGNKIIHATVNGKTRTFTFGTGKVVNYNGVANAVQEDGTIVSSNPTSVSFTFGSPKIGSAKFTNNKSVGYTFNSLVFYTGSLTSALQDSTKYIIYNLSSTLQITGYETLTGGNLEALFDSAHSSWTLAPYITQKMAKVQVLPGANGKYDSSQHAGAPEIKDKFFTYYYGSGGFDVGQFANCFTKVGHTATGWSLAIGSGSTLTTYTDASLASKSNKIELESVEGFNTLLAANASELQDKTPLNLTRTYTANQYKITFEVNTSATDGAEAIVKGASGLVTPGNYIMVTYGTDVPEELPTATKVGHTFVNWTYSGKTLEKKKPFNEPNNITVKATFAVKAWKFVLDANGGLFGSSETKEVTFNYNQKFSDIMKSVANPTRAGFTFNNWHQLTYDGSAYTHVRAIDANTVFNAATFGNIFSETSSLTTGITLYADWNFLDSAYVLTQAATVNSTFGKLDTINFDVKLAVNGTTYTLQASSANLPAAAKVTITKTQWTKSADNTTYSNVSGGTTYLPVIKHVSDAGWYKVILTLTDNGRKVGNISGFPLKTKNVTPSVGTNLTIAKAQLYHKDVNSERIANLKLLTANLKSLLKDITGADTFANTVASSSFNPATSSTLGSEEYIYALPLVAYMLTNNSFRSQILSAVGEDWATFVAHFKTNSAYQTYKSSHKEFTTEFWAQFYSGKAYDGKNTAGSSLASGTAIYYATTAGETKLGTVDSATLSSENAFEKYFTDKTLTRNSASILSATLTLTITGIDDFQANDYDGLTAASGTNKYTLTKDTKAQYNIFALPQPLKPTTDAAVLKNDNSAHRFTAEATFNYNGSGVNTIKKIVAHVVTKAGTAGEYKFSDGGLIIETYDVYINDTAYYTVTRTGDTDAFTKATGSGVSLTDNPIKLNNIAIYIDGTYTIKSNDDVNVFRFGSQLLSSKTTNNRELDKTLTSPEGYTIRITSVSVAGVSAAYSNPNNGSYFDNSGNFVFEIAGNGTATATLYATTSVTSVTIVANKKSTDTYVHYVGLIKNNEDIKPYADLLKSLSAFPSDARGTYTINEKTTGQTIDVNAVFTKAAYVKVSSQTDAEKPVDAGFDNGEYYIDFDATDFTVSVTSPNVAHVLTKWNATGATVDFGESTGNTGKVTLGSQPKVTLTSVYSLAKPSFNIGNITLQADYTKKFVLADLLKYITNWTNKDDGSAVSYSYNYSSSTLGKLDLTNGFARSAYYNGQHTLTITASQTGYVSQSSETKTITFTAVKADITITSKPQSSIDYANSDLATTLSVGLKLSYGQDFPVGGVIDTKYTSGTAVQTATKTLAQLLANNANPNSSYWNITIKITRSTSNMTQIKDVGNYVITITLNATDNASAAPLSAKYLYNAIEDGSFTVVVNKYHIKLSAQDITFDKFYGAPDTTWTKTLRPLNEDVVVTFGREAGEAIGTYDIISASTTNGNYQPDLPSDTHDTFTIKPVPDQKIQAEISEDIVSIIYDGAISLEPKLIFAAGEWKIQIMKGASAIATYTLTNFQTQTGSDDAVKLTTPTADTLAGITFKFDQESIKNVGDYTISSLTNPTNYEGGFEFITTKSAPKPNLVLKITQREIEITGLSKDYDRNTTFNYDFANPEAHGTMKVTATGYKAGDNLTISGTFTQNIGTSLMKDLSLGGTDAGNYTIKNNGKINGTINKKDITLTSITLSQTEFTYGSIKRGLSALQTIVAANLASENLVALSQVQVAVDIIESENYSAKGYLYKTEADGHYTVKVTITSSYYTFSGKDSQSQEIEITVKAKGITLTSADFTAEHFQKDYGEKDPDLTITKNPLTDEEVAIVFSRQTGVQYEAVGTYKLTLLRYDTNYNIILPEDLNLFKINAKANQKIKAQIDGNIKDLVYAGTRELTVQVVFESGDWKIKITEKGTNVITYTLTNFHTSVEESDEELSAVTANTLDGLELEISEETIKDVNTYHFKVKNKPHNYEGGFEFMAPNNDNKAFNITKREIILKNISKTFDRTDDFRYTPGGSDNGTTKVTIDEFVEGDELIITGQFGANIGTSTMEDLSLTGADKDNYTIKNAETTQGTINKMDIELTSITLSKTKFTYGEIKKGLSELKAIAAANYNAENLITLTFAEAAVDITENENYSTAGYLHKTDAHYTVRVTITSAYYTFSGETSQVEDIQITVAAKEITLTAEDFTAEHFQKFYGETDPDMTIKKNPLGNEEVSIVFSRQTGVQYESVGKYEISLQSYDQNYTIKLPQDMNLFEIKAKANQKIKAQIEGSIKEVIYAGTRNLTIQVVFETNTWKIKITDISTKAEVATYTLTGFKTNDGTSDEELASVTANTLAALELEINEEAIKNVGTYHFEVKTQPHNYAGGFEFVDSKNEAFKIVAKELTLKDISKTFDRKDDFNYTTDGSNGSTTVTLDELEAGDQLTITGKFGALIGESTMKDLALGGTDKDNYKIKNLTSTQGTINKAKIEDPKITFSNTTFKYGDISRGLANIKERVTLDDMTLLSDGWAELEIDITDDEEYSAKDFLHQGSYNTTVTLTSNYYTFGEGKDSITTTILVNKYNIVLESGEITFSKHYNDPDPDMTLTKSPLGEAVQIKLTREEGETAKVYKITGAEVQDNDNYSVSLPEGDNYTFTIEAIENDRLTAALEGDPITFKYKGTVTPQVEEAKFANNKWTIKITVDGQSKTFTFSNFQHSTPGQVQQNVDYNETTLAGFTFSITGPVKDVGDYVLTVGGSSENYPGGLSIGTYVVIKIETQEIELQNVTKIFDQTTNFSYTQGGENGNTSATLAGYVDGELIVTGQFGSNIGRSVMTSLALSGSGASNYTIKNRDAVWGTITKANITPTVSLEKTDFTYGDIKKGLAAIKVNVTNAEQDLVALGYVTTKVEIESDSNGNYSTNYLKKGTYQIKITLTSIYYTFGTGFTVVGGEENNYTKDDTTEIQVAQLEIVLSDKDITVSKEYGTPDSEVKELTVSKNPLGDEPVEIKLSRQPGEEVGVYDITDATTTNDNYKITLPANKHTFTITGVSGQKVLAKIQEEIVTQEYNGTLSVSVSLVFEEGSWKIKLTGGVVKTYTLTGFQTQINSEDPQNLDEVNANTLKGITARLVQTSIRNVGKYTIRFEGKTLNYPEGFELTSDSDDAYTIFEITKRKIEFEGFTKVFDENTRFSYDFSLSTDVQNGMKVTIKNERYLSGDNLTVMGQFTSNIGTSAMTTLTLGGTDAGNYEITNPNDYEGTITKAKITPTVALGGTSFTYGQIKEGLAALTVSVTNGRQDLVALKYVTTKVEIEGEDIYSTHSYLKQGTYQVKITLTSQYYDFGEGFTVVDPGDGNSYTKDEKVQITVAQLEIVLSAEDITITKQFGEEDPAEKMTFTKNPLEDEPVEIKLTREQGEEVRTYDILTATTEDNNYKITLPVNVHTFTITGVEGQKVLAEIKEDVENVTYKGAFAVEVTLEYSGSEWQIKLTGGVEKTYTLTNFRTQINEQGEVGLDKVDANTLNGISVRLVQSSIKNVGKYTIEFVGTTLNYPEGFVLTAGENRTDDAYTVFEITKKSIEFDGFTKVFDQNTSFTYDFSLETEVQNGMKVTIKDNGYVSGDKLTVTGQFTENIGESAMKELALGGADAGNYEISTPEGYTGNITKKNITPTVALSKDEFTYGDIKKDLQALKALVTASAESLNLIALNYVEVAVEITEEETYSAKDFLEKTDGSYTVKITLTSKYFTFNLSQDESFATTTTITVAAKDIELSEGDITKTKEFGAEEPNMIIEKDGVGDEVVKITLVREEGEKIGSYHITAATPDNKNYEIHLPTNTETFTITGVEGQKVIAKISEDIKSITYDGTLNLTVTLRFDEGTWKIIIAKRAGEEIATYTLSEFSTKINDADEVSLQTPTADTLDGVTFEFNEASIRNVGDYSIKVVGKATNYPAGFEFISGEKTTSTTQKVFSITQKEITISGISKTFDKGTAFTYKYNGENTMSATIEGILAGDDVTVSGEFGANIGTSTMVGLTLSGADGQNYTIKDVEELQGTINKADMTPTIVFSQNSFTYGDITEDLEELKALVSVTAGEENALQDGLVTFTLELEEEEHFSTGGFLNQGSYTVKITLSSKYYTFKGENGDYENPDEIKITVKQLQITIQVEGEISKEYDTTTDVKQSYSLQGVKEKDLISVHGAYQTSGASAEPIKIVFTTDGADKDNYDITNINDITGYIHMVGITITADLATEEFVDENPAIGTTEFHVDYPTALDGEALMALFTAPTHLGYDFLGWEYAEADQRKTFDKDSVSAALDYAFNNGRTLNIYAKWQIHKFEINITINADQGSYSVDGATPKGGETPNAYLADYYSDVTITSKPNNGYKADQASYNIEKISRDENVSVTFTVVYLTFEVTVKAEELYEPRVSFANPDGREWTGEGNTRRLVSISYIDLLDVKANEFFPTVSVFGYDTDEKWTIVDHEETLDTILTKNLQKFIDTLFESNLHTDVTIVLNPTFKAKESDITLSLNGGNLADSERTRHVTYGQAIPELPNAASLTRKGYTFAYWSYQGVQFSDTIYKYEEGITLEAEWTAADFTLSLSLTNASVVGVYENTEEKTAARRSGDGYILNYEKSYIIEVLPNAGYGEKITWALTEDSADSASESETTKYAISGLYKEATLTITAEPNINTINVKFVGETSHVQNITVVRGEDNLEEEDITNLEDGGYTFRSKTGKDVQITVLLDAGYEITDSSTSNGMLSGEGLEFTLSAFTNKEINISFTVSPKKIVATISFDDTENGHTGINRLTFSGGTLAEGSSSVSPVKINAVVGTPLVVTVELISGFEIESVVTQKATDDFGPDNMDKSIISYTSFTEDFTSTIKVVEKTYQMNAKLIVLDFDDTLSEDSAKFGLQFNSTAKYLTTTTFKAQANEEVKGYKFLGWYEGLLDFNEDGKLEYQDLEIVQGGAEEEFNYSVATPADAAFTAIYKKVIIPVHASVAEGKGTFTFDGVPYTEQLTATYGEYIHVVATPERGYEFDHWLINNKPLSGAQYADYDRLTINETVSPDLTYATIAAYFRPVAFTFDIIPGVLVNGVLKSYSSMSGEFGSIEWGTYDAESTSFTADPTYGKDKTVRAETDKPIYFQVKVNEGFEFVNFEAMDGEAANPMDPIQEYESKTGEVTLIYVANQLNSENKINNVLARFRALSTHYDLMFTKGEDSGIDAGNITIAQQEGLVISGAGKVVGVDAIVGMTFEVTARVTFGYSFDGEDASVILTAGAEGTEISVQDVAITPIPEENYRDGYVYSLNFKIKVSGYNERNTIKIKVKSEKYKVKLVLDDGQDFKTIDDVELGSTTALNLAEVPTKTGYRFDGFWTYANGAGDRFINGLGEQTHAWNLNGYRWDLNEYVKLPNYDETNKTFTLYASFINNKTSISIDAVPPALKEKTPYNLAARSVVVSATEGNSWTSDDIYYMEVIYGAYVSIKAPTYEGYEFAYWTIIKTIDNGNGEPIIEEPIIDEDEEIAGIDHDNCITMSIVATYNAQIKISSSKGGSAYFTYETKGAEGTDETVAVHDTDDNPYAYLQNKKITFYLAAEDGYKFQGLYAGSECVLTKEEFEQAYRDHEGDDLIGFTLPNTEHVATEYYALFIGDEISLNIGSYEDNHGKITAVYKVVEGADDELLSQNEAHPQPITDVRVGDQIKIVADVDDNFEITWKFGSVDDVEGKVSVTANGKTKTYLYTIDYEDLDDLTHSILSLNPTVSQIQCTVTISVSVSNGTENEVLDLSVGRVTYQREDGQTVTVRGSTSFMANLGSGLELTIVPNARYRVVDIKFNGESVMANYDLVTHVFNRTLTSTEGNAFEIIFARYLYIEHPDLLRTLAGSGTGGDPYKIRSVEDLTLLAYMVNVVGDEGYISAHYNLEANLECGEGFWTPIGTLDHKFNGSFYFGTYKISVQHEPGFEGENYYYGVFGVLGSKASISEANQELMIAMIVVGCVLFLVIVALIIYFIWRRQRKKKLEELQNS